MINNIKINSLKESNDFLTILFDNIPSAVLLIDNKFNVKSFNNTFSEMFHKDSDEIIDKICGNALGCAFAEEECVDCGTTFHCDDCHLRNSIDIALKTKISTRNKSLTRVFHIDSKPVKKHFIYTTKILRYDGNEMALVIIDDITDLAETYEKLKEEQEKNLELERKSSVLAMIVTANHELNQPLAVLQGNMELLDIIYNKFGKIENLSKYLAKMRESLKKINSILQKYRENENFDFENYTDNTQMIKFIENSPKKP